MSPTRQTYLGIFRVALATRRYEFLTRIFNVTMLYHAMTGRHRRVQSGDTVLSLAWA